MNRVASFAPIAPDAARILILGSMPGEMSLAAKQYYAHPRNSFWKIMAAILAIPPNATYEQRITALVNGRIALWDVLHSCMRGGSLDANIEADSIQVNDFRAFFAKHRAIEIVAFNGMTAEKHFRRLVLPTLANFTATCVRLPSTSPAHASLTLAEKIAAWRSAIAR